MVLIATVAFGHLALIEASRNYPLGITAESRGGQLEITEVVTFSPGWYAGIRPGDVVHAIDDRPISAGDDPDLLTNAAKVVAVAPNGNSHQTPSDAVPPNPLLRALSLLLAFAFVVSGSLSYLFARLPGPGMASLALTFLCALTIEGNIARASGAPWTETFTVAAVTAVGGACLVSFMVFPVDRTTAPWGRMIARTVAGLHVGLATWCILATTADPAAFPPAMATLHAVLLIDAAGSMLLVMAALLWREPIQTLPRSLYGVVAAGTIVSLAPVTMLSLLPHMLWGEYPVPPYITYLTMVVMPVVQGGGVVRRHLLGMRGLLGRGLIAMGVWAALLSVAALCATVLIAVEMPDASRPLAFFVAAGLLVAFASTERWLRRRLERALLPDFYDLSDVLRSLTEGLVHVSRPEAVATHVLPGLGAALHLDRARLVMRDSEITRAFDWSAAEPLRTSQTLDGRSFEPSYEVPLLVGSSEIGRLSLGPRPDEPGLLPLDIALISSLTPMLTTAVQNARLVEQLDEQIALAREREDQLADLSARLLRAHEEEGKRIAVEIHDDPLQRALFLARQLELDYQHVRPDMLRQEVLDIIASLRAICAGLQPPTLAEFGLVAGLEWLLAEMRARSEIAGNLEVSMVGAEPTDRLEPDLELSLFRIAQEALNNCAKHSGCTRVNVGLKQEHDQIVLRIEDNGVGIDDGAVERPDPDHLGIPGMRQRLNPWGGSVEIGRGEGRGTVVTATVSRDRQTWKMRGRISAQVDQARASWPKTTAATPDQAP